MRVPPAGSEPVADAIMWMYMCYVEHGEISRDRVSIAFSQGSINSGMRTAVIGMTSNDKDLSDNTSMIASLRDRDETYLRYDDFKLRPGFPHDFDFIFNRKFATLRIRTIDSE